MNLTSYYHLKEIRVLKSKRYDCVASTGDYTPFETLASTSKDGRLYFYCNKVPDTFSQHAKRKGALAITRTTNLSSVYVPDIEHPSKGWGDMVHTNDGLLFLFSPDMKEIEVFVAKGLKHCMNDLFTLFLNGSLNGEMDYLRKQAKPIM